MTVSLEFLITSLIVVLLPGTGVLYTLAQGLGRGWRASVFAAFGCTLGILPSLIASIVGLAALLHTSAVAYQFIKYAGVAYLLFMAWGVLRDQGAMQMNGQVKRVSPVKIVLNGFLLNILNPKLSLFFLAFLPQFLPTGVAEPTLRMAELGAVFMLLTFIVFVGYGACASAARTCVISRPVVLRWLRRIFAGAFGLLGLRLAFSDR